MSLRIVGLLLAFVGVIGVEFYDGIINTRVQTATYLTNAVTKILTTFEVKNKGDISTDIIYIPIPNEHVNHLAMFQALITIKTDDDKVDKKLETYIENNLKFNKNQLKKMENNKAYNNQDNTYYGIKLPQKLDKDDTQQIKLTFLYTHMLNSLPKTIKKSGKQFVTYKNNLYFYSPYFTKKLGVKFTLPDKIKSYTKPAASVSDKKITYGPYFDLKGLSYKEAYFHYQFHVPYLSMPEVIRDIEVSHWGNVRFEEKFIMKHDGAIMKGAFEPNLMDRGLMYGHGSHDPSSVRSLKATLPVNTKNAYYIDRIGNISTSNFRQSSKKNCILEIKPRYPLYGGWKTDFTIGYDVPSYELITIDMNSKVYTLNVTFGIPFKEPVVDDLTVVIALPEGATDVNVMSPYEVEYSKESRRYTYLDTKKFGGGRPLIKIHKKNVVYLHNEPLLIKYKYDDSKIYFKPILVIIGIFSFFATIVACSKVDISLEAAPMTYKEIVLNTVQNIYDNVEYLSLSQIKNRLNNAKSGMKDNNSGLKKKITKALKKLGNNNNSNSGATKSIVAEILGK